MPCFHETVLSAWQQPTTHTEPMHRLSHKLSITAKKLREWSKKLVSEVKLKYQMANEVIMQLDIAQEQRQLTQQEYLLRSALKRRVLGYAVIERARKKQASRITKH